MEETHCDVAVIGAGTAGLAAERAARKDGALIRIGGQMTAPRDRDGSPRAARQGRRQGTIPAR